MLVMGWDRINVVGIYVTSITEIHGTMNIKYITVLSLM